MSTRPSRKRRRSQAFPEDDEPVVGEDEAPKYVESTGQDRLDKEREVWDAFKDEHVEVFDLSSSLWRRFDLVRELDQQDARNTASLLDAFLKYVYLRRATAQSPPTVVPPAAESETLATGSETMENPAPSMEDSPQVPTDDSTSASEQAVPANRASSSSNYPPVAPSQSAPADDQSSSREMLATIAKFSEASIRDREEKVNLTLAACDSVERSIRLIDQAIQEQEHAISLGARSGTRLAPILLPELSVPKWTKPARVTLSPDPDDAFDGAQTKAPAPRRKKSKKGRKKDPLPSEAVVPLPRPKPPVIPNADPNEKRYCYCDQVSFGEMIACDDPRCEREWFHLSCTNLPAAPEGRKKWFCDDCTLRKNQKRIR
ncbi:hypothetical protein B0H13DRAFT_2652523 [Mycena leptocephala]|nr:hypothetical protein B0H13DRAFT_2652523 [Mycena leptocephala]